MRHGVRLALGVVVVLAATSSGARAQFYPGGYGWGGWGGWGQNPTDPAAGYMTGLGNYRQSTGVYLEEQAKADAINVDTMLKWNKAMRERQRALDEENAKADAERQARDEATARRLNIESGRSLNRVLDQILEFNAGSKAYAATYPITQTVIRDIPFESQTEGMTICLDQMTADDAWPDGLNADRLAPQRAALQKAVDQALVEDTKGSVSNKTMKKVNQAIDDLRTAYMKTADEATIEYAEADAFLRTMGSLSRMLHNPRLKRIVSDLEKYKSGDVGDLIAFMQAFNLRFGRAESDRQKEIYQTLYPLLIQVLEDTSGTKDNAKHKAAAQARDASGKPFRATARDTFKAMDWKSLRAYDKANEASSDQ